MKSHQSSVLACLLGLLGLLAPIKNCYSSDNSGLIATTGSAVQGVFNRWPGATLGLLWSAKAGYDLHELFDLKLDEKFDAALRKAVREEQVGREWEARLRWGEWGMKSLGKILSKSSRVLTTVSAAPLCYAYCQSIQGPMAAATAASSELVRGNMVSTCAQLLQFIWNNRRLVVGFYCLRDLMYGIRSLCNDWREFFFYPRGADGRDFAAQKLMSPVLDILAAEAFFTLPR